MLRLLTTFRLPEYETNPKMKTHKRTSGFVRTMIAGILCLTHLPLPLAAQATSLLTLEQSTDLTAWQSVPVTPEMIDGEGNILPATDAVERSYRLQVQVLPAPVGGTPPAAVITPLGRVLLGLEHSSDLAGWQNIPVNAAMLDRDGKLQLSAAGSKNFYRLRLTTSPLVPQEFALIPAGAFQMGDHFAEGTGGLGATELPVHSVDVSAFYIGKHEVTKELWDRVVVWAWANGYSLLPTGGGKDANHPVYGINWYDAVGWCNARSQMENLTPCYTENGAIYKATFKSDSVVCNWAANGYRLPTEAEWEKAARGGLGGKRFPWGDTIDHSRANYRGTTGFYSYDLSGVENNFHPDYSNGVQPYTSPVGSFAPNGYGLYDMAGNATEWLWDWFGDYYSSSPSVDPRGPATGAFRASRGGDWFNTADALRVGGRNFNTTNGAGSFRVVRSSIP